MKNIFLSQTGGQTVLHLANMPPRQRPAYSSKVAGGQGRACKGEFEAIRRLDETTNSWPSNWRGPNCRAINRANTITNISDISSYFSCLLSNRLFLWPW